MRKTVTYQLLGFAVILLLMLHPKVSSAQWTLDVMGSVKKEETKKRMEGATITVKRNGSVWKTLTSPANGKFEVSLPPEGIYTIEFSKFGHVTKRIELSTKHVPPDDAKYGFDFPMEMNLFEQMDGLDVSILDKPIAKVAFNPETGYMDYDPAYTKSIKKELDRLKDELAARLKEEEANRKKNQKFYDAAIAAGDKAFEAEKWAEAKPHYEKALSIFPDELHPEFQLGEISDKLASLEAANKKYNSAIEKADKAFAEREWDKAIAEYENAIALKDTEQYPKDKIKEVKEIVANQKKVDKQYKEAIALADQHMLNREYEESKAEYQKASELKSYEEYPKTKIKEIEDILAELAKKDKDYNDAIAEADAAFDGKEYEKSIEGYNKALGFKPEEAYPKGRIDEANRLIAEMKQLEENYAKFIADADAAFEGKDYDAAKSNYQEASNLKSEEQYPKDKLAEIQALLDEAAKLEDDYANAIKEGDVSFESKDYEKSKAAYEKALSLKEEEQYPKDKLAEIEGILADLAKQEEERKALEEQYQGLIAEADKLLEDKSYEEAKGKYNEALAVKSEEQYPKDKIVEIDELLASLAEKEAEEKAKEEQYQALIAEADKMLEDKSYEGAKGKYNEALAVKSEEQYPKDKIAEIDGILAEIAEKEAAAKAKEEQYQGLITEGDKLFGEKSYEESKGKFSAALEIKSEEQYPKDKIAEIEGILADLAKQEAEQKALDEQYQAVIAEADKLFGDKSYEEAKGKYNEALTVKAEEQYPKDKIAEVDGLLEEIARKKAEEEAAKLAEGERDAKYQEAITLADNALEYENYDQAKLKYNEALGVKPEEQYPKDKIKEIDDILAAIAKKAEEDALAAESARKKKEYFDALIAEADAELNGKNYEEALSKYNQASAVIPEEQYPKDKVKEINDILAKLKEEEANQALAQKELDAKYNLLITQADNAFGTKNYSSARTNYQEASNLKSEEQYPKDQLAEIERLLAEQAAKEAEITLTNNALKQKEEEYNGFIKLADAALEGKRYETALSNYKQALGIMPDKPYPKEKIDEIDQLLAAIAEKEKSLQDAALAEKQKRDEYEKLIYDSDRAMKLKEYTKAQVGFKDALEIFPEEKYPKDKLDEITALLAAEAEAKNVTASNSSYTGSRAKITDEKEREIEARMAAMRNKNNLAKDKLLEDKKQGYNKEEEIRISGGIARTEDANKQIGKYNDNMVALSEKGNKYHIENSKTLDNTTKLLNKAENNRIKDANKRRTAADSDLENYKKEEKAFVKEQDKLTNEKRRTHKNYVDKVIDGKVVMMERGDKLRTNNINSLENLKKETAKNEARSEKKRKELELDVLKYKSELAKEEKIMVTAESKKIAKTDKAIQKGISEREKQYVDKSNYYKGNVKELEKFRAKMDKLENQRIKNSEKARAKNQKIKDRMIADIKKNVKRQEKKYYDDVEYLDEYRESVAKYELENLKAADKKRVKSNKEVVKAKEQLNVTTKDQDKRYKMFQENLEKQRKSNDDFLSDLMAMEQEKLLIADAELDNYYDGEKRPRDDEELAKKFPQGITEKTSETGNSIIITRTKVTGTHVDVYERVFYTWGGTFFYKNGVSITQALWDKESIE